MANLRAGLLGIGVMGRNHARVLRDTEGIELVAIADPGGMLSVSIPHCRSFADGSRAES